MAFGFRHELIYGHVVPKIKMPVAFGISDHFARSRRAFPPVDA